MNTPWGKSDRQRQIIKGMTEYCTPRHGGIFLSQERVKQLPSFVTERDNFLRDLRWWEEDCDWAIPYICFADEIGAKHPDRAGAISDAWVSVMHQHPQLYERLAAHYLRNVTPVTPAIDETELMLANREF